MPRSRQKTYTCKCSDMQVFGHAVGVGLRPCVACPWALTRPWRERILLRFPQNHHRSHVGRAFPRVLHGFPYFQLYAGCLCGLPSGTIETMATKAFPKDCLTVSPISVECFACHHSLLRSCRDRLSIMFSREFCYFWACAGGSCRLPLGTIAAMSREAFSAVVLGTHLFCALWRQLVSPAVRDSRVHVGRGFPQGFPRSVFLQSCASGRMLSVTIAVMLGEGFPEVLLGIYFLLTPVRVACVRLFQGSA